MARGISPLKVTTWNTIDGKRIEMGALSLQHLSNIFWYHMLIVNNLTTRITVLNELERRCSFDLELIRKRKDASLVDLLPPYQPYYDWEIEELKTKGLLFGNLIEDGAGNVIGGLFSEAEHLVEVIRKEIGL